MKEEDDFIFLASENEAIKGKTPNIDFMGIAHGPGDEYRR
jgi:hypothetical protein